MLDVHSIRTSVNLPNFSPTVDLPLAALIYASALLATVVWLRRVRSKSDLLIEVTETRVAARILVVVLSLLIPCYLIDFAFWGLTALIVALFIFGLLVGGEPGGIIAGPVFVAALFVKEFVLGFPELILHPETVRQPEDPEISRYPLVGHQAFTASPLRPTGSIVHDGRFYQASSETGVFIESDVPISIVSFRNGVYLVEEIIDERKIT